MFRALLSISLRASSMAAASLLIVCNFFGTAASAQADPQQTLRTALLGHQVYLRSFDAARKITLRWNGNEIAADVPPNLLTLAAFLPSHINVRHDVVTIEGTRRLLLRDGDQLTLARDEVQVELVVEVPSTDQPAVLPQLAQLLFFPSRQQAIAAVPAQYKEFFPTPPRVSKPMPKEKCDCAEKGEPACAGKDASLGARNPRLIRQLDPKFSEEARQSMSSGTVGLMFTVDITGHPVDMWLTKAAGLGLDEKAVEAARKYVFQPSSCHGEPAAVQIFTDINFQAF